MLGPKFYKSHTFSITHQNVRKEDICCMFTPNAMYRNDNNFTCKLMEYIEVFTNDFVLCII